MQMTNRESLRREILVTGEDSADVASTASQLLPENLHLEGVDAAAPLWNRSNRAAAAKRRAYQTTTGGLALLGDLDIEIPVAAQRRPTAALEAALKAVRDRERIRVADIMNGPDMLTTEQFAELLRIDVVTLEGKRRTHLVLGIDDAEHGVRFPFWQVGPDGEPFSALPALYERFDGSAWAVYRFLVRHRRDLNGLTPLEALHRGGNDDVLAVADLVARQASSAIDYDIGDRRAAD
ncbi:hypothetical protein [Thalassobaculum sp.]|uniref:hypothetical protein n=1 Tax=Thalassobaculum sp. TaxID=2022740 RepID=UPI0032EB5B1D